MAKKRLLGIALFSIILLTILLPSVFAEATQCSNGIDDDGDDKIDALIEPADGYYIYRQLIYSNESDRISEPNKQDATLNVGIRLAYENIGNPGTPPLGKFDNADWIWHPLESENGKLFENKYFWIERKFNLPATSEPGYGENFVTFKAGADDEYDAYINGIQIGTNNRDKNYENPTPHDVDPSILNVGENTLRIKLINNDGPSSLAYSLDINVRKKADCKDGIDNDGDGLVDLADDGCASGNDISEGVHDLGCMDSSDNDEVDPDTCHDGIDNDYNGKMDALEEIPVNQVQTITYPNRYVPQASTHETARHDPDLGIVSGLEYPELQPGDKIKIVNLRGIYYSGDKGKFANVVTHDCATEEGNAAGGVAEVTGGFYSNYEYYDTSGKIGNYYKLKDMKNGVTVPAGAVTFQTFFNDVQWEERWAGRCDYDIVIERGVNVNPACSNGIDDDNDGLTDSADDGCNSDRDTSEVPHDLDCISGTEEVAETNICSDPSQILFRLTQQKDSFATAWNKNESLFTYQVCFDDIFGYSYPAEGNVHDATGADFKDNLIFLLTGKTSSTANAPEGTGAAGINYGELSCRSATSCTSEEVTVASLSGSTNARVSTGNDANMPIKICCTSPILSITGAYWTNNNDLPITTTDLNSLVKLKVGGTEFEGKEINFTIMKSVWYWFDKKVSQSNSQNSITWRAGNNSTGGLNGGTYYFIVDIDDETYTSGNLVVSDEEINSPPVASITSPENKQIYFIEEVLDFTQDSYDKDDPFNYTWELDDGTILSGDSTTWENYNFTHAFFGEENKGQQNIKLTVTDERGLTSTDRISILVINSTYVLAYIDSPVPSKVYGRVVDYDATSTYAVSSETGLDGCTKTIACVAGNCPSEAKGHPPCYPAGADPITVANSPETPDFANYDNLEFCWTFDGDTSNKLCATGSNGVQFQKKFSRIGQHSSTLEVDLANNE